MSRGDVPNTRPLCDCDRCTKIRTAKIGETPINREMLTVRSHDSGETWEWRFRTSHAGGFVNPCNAEQEGLAAVRVLVRSWA